MNPRWPAGRFAPRGLYLVTPDDQDSARLLRRVLEVLPHAAMLQYRNKTADARLRRLQANALLEICCDAGVLLIVNDDWRLAVDIGAHGVHLGEHDGEIGRARDALGAAAVIGASCYDDIRLAERAVAAGADYVAFGAFFASPTKPRARRAAPDLFQQAARLAVPGVAIGGITPDNAHEPIAAGADLVAVISGVFDAHDPAEAARDIAALFP